MATTRLPLHADRIDALHRERCGLQSAARDIRAEIKAGETSADQAALRLARINAEIAAVRSEIAAAEADAVKDGFNLYMFRDVLRLRRMTACDRAEHDALLAMYRDELGIPAGRPGR